MSCRGVVRYKMHRWEKHHTCFCEMVVLLHDTNWGETEVEEACTWMDAQTPVPVCVRTW